ncbi:hypothetical protein [Haloplanus sp. C73]|uniref:hypothetical protein n=1 Tax=Haloplanus sp. C73 TaxID=3421641 RepID=UPI003EBB8DA7
MKYGTWLKKDGESAEVVTSPKKQARTYRYPFVRVGDAWMLDRERDWYTEHALQYAAMKLDAPLVHKRMHPNQTVLDDFTNDRPSDDRVGAGFTIALAD